MIDEHLPRRDFLLGAGVAAPLSVLALSARAQVPGTASAPEPTVAAPLSAPPATPPAPRDMPTCLNPAEWAFVEAASNVMIPADALSPSGAELGIPVFIDRQLGGAYGAGARTYRSGPFRKGKPQQGGQSALTPREFFGLGVTGTNALARRLQGRDFDRLDAAEQDALLHGLDAGKLALDHVSGAEFVGILLTLVKEGFFSDPSHGGNRGKASWTMIGFPGLPALYADTMLSARGKPYHAAPRSIGDEW